MSLDCPEANLCVIGAGGVGRHSLADMLQYGTVRTIEDHDGNIRQYYDDSENGHSGWKLRVKGRDVQVRCALQPGMPQGWLACGGDLRLLRQSDGCILIYDVTNKESLEYIKHFYNECYLKLGSDSKAYQAFWIVANKVDNEIARAASLAEGEAFALDIDVSFYPIAAWTGQGMVGMQEAIVSHVLAVKDGALSPHAETRLQITTKNQALYTNLERSSHEKGRFRALKERIATTFKTSVEPRKNVKDSNIY